MIKLILHSFIFTFVFSQEAFDGLTLYSPTSGNGSHVTYLVDQDQEKHKDKKDDQI